MQIDEYFDLVKRKYAKYQQSLKNLTFIERDLSKPTIINQLCEEIDQIKEEFSYRIEDIKIQI